MLQQGHDQSNVTDRELLELLEQEKKRNATTAPEPTVPSIKTAQTVQVGRRTGMSREAGEAAFLESLWATRPGEVEPTANAEPDLSALFMNPEASAQAALTGVEVAAVSAFDIQFDTDEFIDAPSPPRTGRFRIDQPPPPRHFERRMGPSPDGVVVASRDRGQWQTQQVRQAAAPRPVPVTTPVRAEPAQNRSALPTMYDVLRRGGLDIE